MVLTFPLTSIQGGQKVQPQPEGVGGHELFEESSSELMSEKSYFSLPHLSLNSSAGPDENILRIRREVATILHSLDFPSYRGTDSHGQGENPVAVGSDSSRGFHSES